MRPHTVATGMALWTLSGAAHHGHDVAAILRRAGLAEAVDKSLPRVPVERYAALLRTLRRVMRDELWGMCSRPVPVGSFNAVCQQLSHCVSLRDAIETGLAHYRRLIPDFSARLRVEAGVAEVRLQPRPGACALVAAAESVFCYHMIRLAWRLVGRRFPLLKVQFRHSEMPWTAETRLLLQAESVSNADHSGLWFAAHWLDLPVLVDKQKLGFFLHSAFELLLERECQPANIIDMVQSRLRHELSSDIPSLKELASSLNLTESTLKRRLEQEGSHFRALKDMLRRDTACNLLRQTGMPLWDVAQRVGFSDPAAFSRAFKRWTGVAPGEFRTRGACHDAPAFAPQAEVARDGLFDHTVCPFQPSAFH